LALGDAAGRLGRTWQGAVPPTDVGFTVGSTRKSDGGIVKWASCLDNDAKHNRGPLVALAVCGQRKALNRRRDRRGRIEQLHVAPTGARVAEGASCTDAHRRAAA